MRNLPSDYQYDDPAVTLELLSELEGVGLTDEAFALMHHFEKPERIANHRSYCLMVQDEGGNFRTVTNRLVQRRLELILKILTLANIRNRTPSTFLALAELSISEFPHAAKRS
jgi:hypothetical protein